MFNVNQLILNLATSEQLLRLLSQKELFQVRTILFPERYKFITPKKMKGLGDPRFRKQLNAINAAKKDSKEVIIQDITRFKFSPTNIKIIILIFKMLEIIGAPTPKLLEMIEELGFPHFSRKPANRVRYYFIGWFYELPSTLIRMFLEKANNRSRLREFLELDGEHISSKLTELGIPDSIDSLPSSCINYRRYFLLNELFKLPDYRRLTEELEIYPNDPKKWEQAFKLTFHTNISLPDLIDHLDANSFQIFKVYFLKIYNLSDIPIHPENAQLRTKIKEAMVYRGEGRDTELWANPHIVWGGETKHIAIDGHKCDSKWELEIDNYLFNSEIKHKKPVGASRGKYYRNRMMYPDWIINGVMVELFGAVHLADYIDKMIYKQHNFLLPLRGISKEEYETGVWRDIIQDIINS